MTLHLTLRDRSSLFTIIHSCFALSPLYTNAVSCLCKARASDRSG